MTDSNNPELRCTRCHTSGPRTLELNEAPTFPATFGGVRDLNEFNDLISQDRLLDYNLYYDEKYFPMHLPIGESVGCVDCHGPKRNSLAVEYDATLWILNYKINNGSMPYHSKMPLTSEQRSELIARVSSDYYAQLGHWLTEVKCGVGKAKPLGPEQGQKAAR